MITNVVDDTSRDDLAVFDDDDPFNLPPPLPPLSPQREEDGTNQDGDAVQGDQDAGDGDKKESNKKRKVKRSPRPKLDEFRWESLNFFDDQGIWWKRRKNDEGAKNLYFDRVGF